jgi:hypothetical protein
MNRSPQHGVLPQLLARWMKFENRAFESIMKAERRVRQIPPHVRLQPAQFDRRLFRVFVGACVSLVLIATVVPSSIRSIAILVFFFVLFFLVVALMLIDTFPKGSR